MHKCTDDDLEKFNEPRESFQSRIESIKKSGQLHCLDQTSELVKIWGERDSDHFGSIEVLAVPCHSTHLTDDITV